MDFERLDNTKVEAISIWVILDKFKVSIGLQKLEIFVLGYFEIVGLLFGATRGVVFILDDGGGNTRRPLILLLLLLPLVVFSDHAISLIA